MKGWPLLISVTLGLIGVVAVLLSILVEWPGVERLPTDAPAGAPGTPTPSAGS